MRLVRTIKACWCTQAHGSWSRGELFLFYPFSWSILMAQSHPEGEAKKSVSKLNMMS